MRKIWYLTALLAVVISLTIARQTEASGMLAPQTAVATLAESNAWIPANGSQTRFEREFFAPTYTWTLTPEPDHGLIRPTRAISIPFGFDTPLTIEHDSRHVIATGHGGCTPGEQVTVDVVITQGAEARASGQTQEECTGQRQTWAVRAAVEGSATLTAGPARACGMATTRAGNEITDAFEWCRDIELTYRTYLPVLMQNL